MTTSVARQSDSYLHGVKDPETMPENGVAYQPARRAGDSQQSDVGELPLLMDVPVLNFDTRPEAIFECDTMDMFIRQACVTGARRSALTRIPVIVATITCYATLNPPSQNHSEPDSAS